MERLIGLTVQSFHIPLEMEMKPLIFGERTEEVEEESPVLEVLIQTHVLTQSDSSSAIDEA
ncbi:hypothetical protein TorRG33x02_130560 [Trema orientale]|uniref:Uncharacterized protein n=1 Tax=Trema orientale TaxID=63057 RepID=A0A2P5F0C7_TREOI|nr:hypothetical protein TorRG33x02_130560 [Trema orientale]